MGNRFQGGIAPGAMPPLHRYLGNPVLTFVGRLFFRSPMRRLPLRPARLPTRRDPRRSSLRTTGMEFASEMVVKATLDELRITEVPTTLSPDGRSRPPHLRTWRDGWRHLRFLLLYSPRWLFLYPGISVVLGLSLGAALLPGPLEIGSVGLDVNALVYAMVMVLIGFQAIMFAVFYARFAMNEGLLPPSRGLERAFRIMTFERGLIVGRPALARGLGIAIYSLVNWGSQDFGALDTRDAIRVVVPGATALVLGFE